MFVLQHIHKSFAEKVILDDINLSVNAGEVIALIGENGAGKTTLLKLITGEIKPDSGSITLQGETIGYVPQEAPLGLTLGSSFTSAAEPWRIEQALSLVGLGQKDLKTTVDTLSGGQKTRLAFATVLARDPEPTTLLLDEPTNNLDAEGLVWLERFIASFTGNILLVSHDRAFINRVASGIIELSNGMLRHYGGNYDFYKQQKQIEYQSELERYQENIEERKHLVRVLREKQERAARGLKNKKLRDNDKAQFDWHQNNVQRSFSGQAKALQSRLDRLKDIERPKSAKAYKVSLSGKVPHNKLVMRIEALTKRFDREVLHDINLEIRGGERLHITGQNGSGKTTLLKVAAGLIKPDSGEVTLGLDISIGYFSQDIDGLDHHKTALENLELTQAKPTEIYREARSLGLTAHDLKKPVSRLSRGQQAKLGFAKLLLGAHQLLILDEPTNHLDIPTRERIEAALSQYVGAILFASHDTYFADSITANKTFNLKEGRLQ